MSEIAYIFCDDRVIVKPVIDDDGIKAIDLGPEECNSDFFYAYVRIEGSEGHP